MADVKILIKGFTNADHKVFDGVEETCPTVSLVRDKDMIMVVDPGVLADQQLLVEALKKEGLTPDQVNVVGITHSHIDHYRNVGMFKNAKVIEYFGIWEGGKVEDWQEQFSSDIQILKTPGHSDTAITFFVRTKDGVVAICGDVFWKEGGPDVDPFAQDQMLLQKSRGLVVKMSSWIIPGHGPIYKTPNRAFIPLKKSKKKLESLGNCKECNRPFATLQDQCPCQTWLCFRCCECKEDCGQCHCKHKR